MKKLEVEVTDYLYNQSIVFLQESLYKLLADDNDAISFNKNITLACVSLQVSLELAIKSLIVRKLGLRGIISNGQKKLTDDEIIDRYYNNRIKTADFDVLKNCVKSNNFVERLNKSDFKIIDDFQLYRNKIFHFVYNFNNNEHKKLESNILYYLLNIVLRILSELVLEDIPSMLLENILGHSLMNKLIKYEPYRFAMETLVKDSSDKVYSCIFCNARTMVSDQELCYCCNMDYGVYTMTDCSYCNEKGSVIYDNLNIDANGYSSKGLCLNCDEDSIIFECPKCGIAYNIEAEIGCTLDKCLNE